MKKIIYILNLLVFYNVTYSQTNLVPNGSFEQYISCPNVTGAHNLLNDWFGVGSVDFYHTCSTSSDVGVPYNWGGFQYPADGNAYSGLTTYTSRTLQPNGREYLGVELITPLNIGIKYFFSLKINLSYSNILWSNCASNNIGIILTDINNVNFLSKSPIYYTNSIQTDTANWTNLYGSFLADSTYNTLYIGNFFDDSNTDTLIMDTNDKCLSAYYFIDDVRLSTDSSLVLKNQPKIESDGLIHIKNNIVGETLFIISDFNDLIDFSLYDYTGKSVKSGQLKKGNNVVFFDDFASGIYVLHVKYNNQIINYKILKQ